MKFGIRTFISVVLLAVLSSGAKADFLYPYYFFTNNNSVSISGYVGPSSAVTLPKTIVGLPVTDIASGAFYESGITSITISDNVTNIGASAFDSCSNLYSVTTGTNVANLGEYAFFNCIRLTNVTMAVNLTNIGDKAFWNCTQLKSIFIPNGVTNISGTEFYNCVSLEAINVDPANPVFGTQNGALFNKMQNVLLRCPEGKAGGFLIPEGVTAIADNAFEHCGYITNITIPDSVTNMGNSTFQYCSNLISVNIGSDVSEIGAHAFLSCFKLKDVTIPENVTTIGDQAFQSCGSITSIVIPNSVTNMGLLTFQLCTNLASARLSTNISTIPLGTFRNCPNLTDAPIPDGITSIEDWAFLGCTRLSKVAIPDAVTNIGVYAFNGCGLTSLTIGNSVTTIGQRAFLGCSTLATSITIPSSVNYIGDYAFAVLFRVPAFFFQGDAPILGGDAFWDDLKATAYYLPGANGWTNSIGYIPAVLWNPEMQTGDGNFGVHTNGFGFTITGTPNIPIMVEASTNLTTGNWIPLQNCNVTNGSIDFRDSASAQYPSRIYRIRSP